MTFWTFFFSCLDDGYKYTRFSGNISAINNILFCNLGYHWNMYVVLRICRDHAYGFVRLPLGITEITW